MDCPAAPCEVFQGFNIIFCSLVVVRKMRRHSHLRPLRHPYDRFDDDGDDDDGDDDDGEDAAVEPVSYTHLRAHETS